MSQQLERGKRPIIPITTSQLVHTSLWAATLKGTLSEQELHTVLWYIGAAVKHYTATIPSPLATADDAGPCGKRSIVFLSAPESSEALERALRGVKGVALVERHAEARFRCLCEATNAAGGTGDEETGQEEKEQETKKQTEKKNQGIEEEDACSHAKKLQYA